jgi:hypothetical protein
VVFRLLVVGTRHGAGKLPARGRGMPHPRAWHKSADDDTEPEIEVPIGSLESVCIEAVTFHRPKQRQLFRSCSGSPWHACGMTCEVEKREDRCDAQK